MRSVGGRAALGSTTYHSARRGTQAYKVSAAIICDTINDDTYLNFFNGFAYVDPIVVCAIILVNCMKGFRIRAASTTIE